MLEQMQKSFVWKFCGGGGGWGVGVGVDIGAGVIYLVYAFQS